MKWAELHIHTHYSNHHGFESISSPKQVLEAAKKKGLSAIAITDHNTIEGYREAHALAHRYGITVIPGIEVDTNGREQVLGYGIKGHIKPRRDIYEIIGDIQSQGGIAIVAHPNDPLHGSRRLKEVLKKADGVEILNSSSTWNRRTMAFVEKHRVNIVTAGSDAHHHAIVGSTVCGFLKECKSVEDYLTQIREGNITIRETRHKNTVKLMGLGNIILVVMVKSALLIKDRITRLISPLYLEKDLL
jgi:predicted metal-dependent phosphoesterase TrpH